MYITVMFPYPSGAGLHIGHWYNYAIVDSYCRVRRYIGEDIFQPFGYDAFGLPAENYARKIGGDVQEITHKNILNFRNEMERMNTSFEERLVTCSPEYVRRTQWLFTELYKRGLAYQAVRSEPYCDQCQTVLAREQVCDTKCINCGGTIENRELKQWFFKITEYTDRLISDLDKVDYPESTKKKQLNWLKNQHDWCVSRQRKWGCPIPIEGETDTLDTFVDSSFYTIEYDKTRPVDIYVGGSEHACMHLIYARFITKFLCDIGYIDFDEPFNQVIHQGMILGPDGHKMSKSRGNVVDSSMYDPQLLRMYLMFINHYFEGGQWSDQGYSGCDKFRKRFLKWVNNGHGHKDGQLINTDDFKSQIVDLFSKWKTNRVVSDWMSFYKKHKSKTPDIKTSSDLYHFFNTCF